MNAKRDAEMVRLHAEEGWTLTEIARAFGLSCERVRQIIRGAGVPSWVTREVRSHAATPEERFVCEVCGKEEWLKPYNARKTCGATECVTTVRSTSKKTVDWAARRTVIVRVIQGLADEHGRAPSLPEIAYRTGWSVPTLARAFGRAEDNDISYADALDRAYSEAGHPRVRFGTGNVARPSIRKHPLEDDLEIIARHDAGEASGDIAQSMGVPVNHVYSVLYNRERFEDGEAA